MNKFLSTICMAVFIINNYFIASPSLAQGIFELEPISVTADAAGSGGPGSPQQDFLAWPGEEDGLRAVSPAEASEAAPFVWPAPAGGPGAIATPGIMGGSASQTLLLIDGRPVNSPALGNFNLGLLPAEAFGGMEVFYGPASPRFGINGLSGALSLSGRRPVAAKNSTAVRSAISSFGGSENSIYSSFYDARSGSSHGIFLKRHIYGGYRPNSDFRADYAGYTHGFRAGSKLEGYFSLFHAASANGAPGAMPAEGRVPRFGGAEASSLYDRQSDRLCFANLDLEYAAGGGRSFALKLYDDAQSGHFDTRYADWLSGALILSVSDARTRSRGAFASYTLRAAGGELKAGAGRVKNSLASRESSFNAALSAEVAAAENSPSSAANSCWARYKIARGPWGLEAGLNHDRPDFFRPANSYSAGVSRRSGGAGVWKFFHARGYRAPTLNDLYYPGAGNPSLKPESGVFDSVSFETAGRCASASLRLFAKRTSDMIEWFPDPADPSGFRWTPQNINSFSGRGAAVSFDRRVRGGLGAGIYIERAVYRQKNLEESYNDFAGDRRFVQTERQARQLPACKAVLKLYGRLTRRTGFSLVNSYASEMKFYYADYSAAPLVRYNEKVIGAGVVSDLEISRELSRDSRVDLRVSNLFDKNYARRFGSSFDDRDYPMPGRNFRIAFNRLY